MSEEMIERIMDNIDLEVRDLSDIDYLDVLHGIKDSIQNQINCKEEEQECKDKGR